MTETKYSQVTEWPYPVNCGKGNEISADVLVIGGGLAGCYQDGARLKSKDRLEAQGDG